MLDGGGAASAGAGLLGRLIPSVGDGPRRLRRHGFHPNLAGVECPQRPQRTPLRPPVACRGEVGQQAAIPDVTEPMIDR